MIDCLLKSRLLNSTFVFSTCSFATGSCRNAESLLLMCHPLVAPSLSAAQPTDNLASADFVVSKLSVPTAPIHRDSTQAIVAPVISLAAVPHMYAHIPESAIAATQSVHVSDVRRSCLLLHLHLSTAQSSMCYLNML